jgi:hypothetical protein
MVTASSAVRGVGMGDRVCQTPVPGSYTSTVATFVPPRKPPIAYNWPFTAAAASPVRAVGIPVSVVQELATGSYDSSVLSGRFAALRSSLM